MTAAAGARRPTVVIADFFGTVKERGIAAYVRDLEQIAARSARVVVLRAPRFVRRLPSGVQNLLMVLHEQFYVPLACLFHRPDLIIFPYNSSSILLSALNRTICVIHDLIPYKKTIKTSRMSFAYVACTARWHAARRGRFVAVSAYTARILRSLDRFRQSDVTLIPNSFLSLDASFAQAAQHQPLIRDRVLLISGVGPNKDFAGALGLMEAIACDPETASLGVDILGFGDSSGVAEAMIAERRAAGARLPDIAVFGLLPQDELIDRLRSARIVWAHTTAEGFGRVVVEGRLAGRPVVMSQLAVFASLKDDATFAYANGDGDDFCRQLRSASGISSPGRYAVTDRLRSEAVAGLQAVLAA